MAAFVPGQNALIDRQAFGQRLAELSSDLKRVTGLRSVRLIPADAFDWGSWTPENVDGDPIAPHTEPFSVQLGRLASPMVAYEIACQILRNQWTLGAANNFGLRSFQPSPIHQRIGVASGSTVRALVDAFSLPPHVYATIRDSRDSRVTVSPLVVGPLPETTSSAGFIAETLTQKFPHLSTVKQVRIHDTTPVKAAHNSRTGFTIELNKDVVSARDRFRNTLHAPGTPKPPRAIMEELNSDPQISRWITSYNWILTGIGANGSGQLESHLQHRFSVEKQADLKLRVAGDICSRLFDNTGAELESSDADQFVGIPFEALRFLSAHTQAHVVAVAGGTEKYPALYTLLRVEKSHRVFNELITDEITARCLLRDLAVDHAK